MQRHVKIAKQLISLLLSGVMMFAVLWRSGHEYFEFHDPVLHCDDQGESHIHDDRYAAHDCFVCAFHFSPTQSWEPGLTFTPPLPTVHEKFAVEHLLDNSPLMTGYYLRGPPVFL